MLKVSFGVAVACCPVFSFPLLHSLFSTQSKNCILTSFRRNKKHFKRRTGGPTFQAFICFVCFLQYQRNQVSALHLLCTVDNTQSPQAWLLKPPLTACGDLEASC